MAKQLKDLLVTMVALVDSPANKRKFLLIKRKEGKMDNEDLENPLLFDEGGEVKKGLNLKALIEEMVRIAGLPHDEMVSGLKDLIDSLKALPSLSSGQGYGYGYPVPKSDAEITEVGKDFIAKVGKVLSEKNCSVLHNIVKELLGVLKDAGFEYQIKEGQTEQEDKTTKALAEMKQTLEGMKGQILTEDKVKEIIGETLKPPQN